MSQPTHFHPDQLDLINDFYSLQLDLHELVTAARHTSAISRQFTIVEFRQEIQALKAELTTKEKEKDNQAVALINGRPAKEVEEERRENRFGNRNILSRLKNIITPKECTECESEYKETFDVSHFDPKFNLLLLSDPQLTHKDKVRHLLAYYFEWKNRLFKPTEDFRQNKEYQFAMTYPCIYTVISCYWILQGDVRKDNQSLFHYNPTISSRIVREVERLIFEWMEPNAFTKFFDILKRSINLKQQLNRDLVNPKSTRTEIMIGFHAHIASDIILAAGAINALDVVSGDIQDVEFQIGLSLEK